MDGELTKGVKNLLGDPKKAIIKISFPMMVAFLINSMYNLVDGFWVAGLGPNALAAIGLFFPFFMLIMAIGIGIGIGGSSAVSRLIGAKNKEAASNTAVHTIILGVILSVALSLPVLPFLNHIFMKISGSLEVSLMAVSYARVIFLGSILIIFSQISHSLLQGEGDSKRAMYAMLVGSILNIFLDPIFIYTFNLGVQGAAIATMISIFVSCLFYIYWLFIKRNTYVVIRFRNFKFKKGILKDILKVGFPSSLSHFSMSIASFALNIIIVIVAGTDGIAVFTSGWRILMIGTVPLFALATGVTAVTGAAFGAKNKEKLNTAFNYSIKLGILIELIIGIFIFIFAPQISLLFTYSEGAARISGDLISYLRITFLLFVTVPIGIITVGMLNGIGKGLQAMFITILRTLILMVPFTYVFGVSLNLGLIGVIWGLVIGNIFAVLIAFFWGKLIISKLPI